MKKYFLDIAKTLKSHDLFNLSASISYFAILSLIPLSMIFISALGHVAGAGAVVVHQIADNLTNVVPGARDIFLTNIEKLVRRKSPVGWLGIGFLLLISTVLFSSLEKAFNKIFGSERKRNFFHSRFLAVVVIFGFLLLLCLPSAIGLFEAILVKYGYSVPLSSYISGKPFFVVFGILSYVVAITIIPNRRVYLRYAFVGAVLYTVGIALAKYLFHWYLGMAFDKYNIIYGSLTAMILTVVWIYYLTFILLLSAEVVAYLQGRKKI